MIGCLHGLFLLCGRVAFELTPRWRKVDVHPLDDMFIKRGTDEVARLCGS